MTTTGERARVERWAVSDPRGEQFWYCSNEQEAKERAANWSKFEHLPYRAFLLREVDPAHDSAVARLCEAARELSRVSLLWVKNCPCGCGSCASTERALEVLDTALSDPALPGAAKGEQVELCPICPPGWSGCSHIQPPTTPQPSVESAEQFVRRVAGGSYEMIQAALEHRELVRDSAQQARHDARVAGLQKAWALEYEDMQRTIREKDAEIARLEKNLKVAIEQRDVAQAEAFSLRTRLAAGAGIDRELLETARAIMPGVLVTIEMAVNVGKAGYPEGWRDGAADEAVKLARALHAALAAKEVRNG